MAQALLDRETLDREEVQLLAKGQALPPKTALAPVLPSPVRPGTEVVSAGDRKPVLGSPPPEPAGA
jgi:hypothetical protein